MSNLKKYGGLIANYSYYNSEGQYIMTGLSRPWRDEVSDAISLQQTGPGVSRNSTESTVDYTTGSNLSDFMYCNIQLNHDKDLISSIYPHLHFFQTEDHMPNFLLRFRWQLNGGVKTTGWTDLKCNLQAFTPYVGGTVHQIAYSLPIETPPGSIVSDIVQFKIYRDNAGASTIYGSAADPYTATVGVLAFDIHFQINTLGSDDQYTK